jgi:hypothetical protein
MVFRIPLGLCAWSYIASNLYRLDPCCLGLLHLCIWINILGQPNLIRPCNHMHPHANVYLPYACFPMSMLIRPPLLATITLAHSHAQHLPRVFPTVLSFALVVLPTFNICFLFLLSCHVCWGRNLWHMTLFLWKPFFSLYPRTTGMVEPKGGGLFIPCTTYRECRKGYSLMH